MYNNASLDSICDNKLADISPQCFSAKYVDKNNKPILFYFGFRPKEPNHRYGVSIIIIFYSRFITLKSHSRMLLSLKISTRTGQRSIWRKFKKKIPTMNFYLMDYMWVISSFFFWIFYLSLLQPNQCEAYKVACQSLCSVMPLHARQDSTRHLGDSIMSYEREDNPDAYEASLHGEQGGVCHLVHGWIQQNIESRVIIIHYPFLAFFFNRYY